MLGYHMKGFSGYGIQYSPYFDNRLAVASGSNFGLVGNGKLFILDIANDGTIRASNSFLTQDCLFDTAWNELHENQVLVAQGDGSLRLFDTTLKEYPIAIFQEHEREVFSCSWNLLSKNSFVSSSWDGSVKVWSPIRSNSLLTLVPQPMKLMEHAYKVDLPNPNQQPRAALSKNKDCIYQAQFSPHDNNLVLCSAGNSYTTLFDLRQPDGASNQHNFFAHSGLEALTCDFNKYRPNIVATGGVDNAIRIWDLRMLGAQGPSHAFSQKKVICVNEISGAHELAVRKISWSPHKADVLLSTSYDMTCSVWKDLSCDGNMQNGKTNSTHFRKGLISNFTNHSEFVFGADWSLWGHPGFIASTSWDGNVFIWNGFR